MASTVTLAALTARAFRLADLTADEFRSEADVYELVNTHVGAVWDELASANPDDFAHATENVTVVAGTTSYALPAAFRHLTGVYEVTGSGTGERLREIAPLLPGRRRDYAPPQAGGTVRLEYVRQPTALSSGGDTVDVQFAGIDELIVCLVARDLLLMQDLDTRGVDGSIAALRHRLKAAASRRHRGITYITDVYESEADDRLPGVSQSLAGYRLRGSNIELYASTVF